MDITALEGQELTAVEFVGDYLRLRFDGPMLTLYAWPHLLFPDFSLAFGEPEYRNGLCAQIGENVATASLEELDALTLELESGTVIALSLREEELSGPVAGSWVGRRQRSRRRGILVMQRKLTATLALLAATQLILAYAHFVSPRVHNICRPIIDVLFIGIGLLLIWFTRPAEKQSVEQQGNNVR